MLVASGECQASPEESGFALGKVAFRSAATGLANLLCSREVGGNQILSPAPILVS